MRSVCGQGGERLGGFRRETCERRAAFAGVAGGKDNGETAVTEDGEALAGQREAGSQSLRSVEPFAQRACAYSAGSLDRRVKNVIGWVVG